MFNGVSAEDVDPFYPAVYADVTDVASAVETVDTCLMHPQADGVNHYHALSPCIINNTYGNPEEDCTANSECSADLITYAMAAYVSTKTLYPVGIAKDGHVIWGPYN